jgi:hypothetical protein
MLICHHPSEHLARQRNAICLRGHSLQVCVEPACLDDATACPIADCKSPIALLLKPIDQPLSLSMSL